MRFSSSGLVGGFSDPAKVFEKIAVQSTQVNLLRIRSKAVYNDGPVRSAGNYWPSPEFRISAVTYMETRRNIRMEFVFGTLLLV